MIGKCMDCGGGTPNSTCVLCGKCSTESNRCTGCLMDMAKAESTQCYGTHHLQFDRSCGGCKTWARLKEYETHETIDLAEQMARSQKLVVHQWIFFSLLGTGTTGADWKQITKSDYLRSEISEKCISVRAQFIGSGKVRFETDPAKTDKKYSVEFDIEIVNPD
jgi:hypothetical protein